MPVSPLFAFFVAFLSFLTFNPLCIALPLLFFAPYLAVILFRLSLPQILFHSFSIGLFLDLFSSSTRFGITGLAYAIACRLLFMRRYDLFEDSLSTFPILSALFSILVFLSEWVLNTLFGSAASISFKEVAFSLFLLPFLNALYALCLFTLPWYLWSRIRKRRRTT